MNACRLSGFFVLSLIVCLVALGVSEKPPSTVVVISANAEWHPFRGLFPEARIEQSPFGEYFVHDLDVGDGVEKVVFLHGGWGKISAAASAQFAIDRWSPRLLVNLGTCGGFKGAVEPGEVLLVEKTIVYDIVEKMGDASEAIAEYTTDLDLDWLQPPYPTPSGVCHWSRRIETSSRRTWIHSRRSTELSPAIGSREPSHGWRHEIVRGRSF